MGAGDALFVAAITIGPLLFWLPSIVGFIRGLPFRWQLLLLNTFIGATGIGWMVCAILAITPRRGRSIQGWRGI